ncbi:site-specific integrase [Hymenobacter gummosus]|uniref:site-specific integrase n=1 Tax=Hymenobacter gummosus TaxID=1776032 RepID=UPI001A9F2A66|nr:site-specific integrase [Hymenobacter gummosus]
MFAPLFAPSAAVTTMSKTTDHKEGRASVKVFYKTGKTLADGSHPFYVRIIKNRKQVTRATGLSLHPKYWNHDKQEIRRNYPEPYRSELIQKLDKWVQKFSDAAGALADADERHEADDVLSRAAEERKQLRRVKVLEFTQEVVDELMKTNQVGNASVYRDLRNQLLKFIRDEYHADDIAFERVTVAFCNRWETVLRASGIREITLSLRFRTLRAVLNKAIANGDAKLEHYPFARNAADKHKFSIGKFDVTTQKRAVSRDAVRKLEQHHPSTERLRLAKDVFLFSFYCGGINFVDLAQLRWSNLTAADAEGKTLRLRYERQKTGGKFVMKLLPPAAAIVEFYRLLTHDGPMSYVFPILRRDQHITTTQIKNRLHKVLGQVNKDLKTLAATVGIDTPLTTYVARHSFATSLKQSGVATGIISEAMGHKSEAVTAVYLGSFESETLEQAFENLL